MDFFWQARFNQLIVGLNLLFFCCVVLNDISIDCLYFSIDWFFCYEATDPIVNCFNSENSFFQSFS